MGKFVRLGQNNQLCLWLVQRQSNTAILYKIVNCCCNVCARANVARNDALKGVCKAIYLRRRFAHPRSRLQLTVIQIPHLSVKNSLVSSLSVTILIISKLAARGEKGGPGRGEGSGELVQSKISLSLRLEKNDQFFQKVNLRQTTCLDKTVPLILDRLKASSRIFARAAGFCALSFETEFAPFSSKVLNFFFNLPSHCHTVCVLETKHFGNETMTKNIS